MKRTLALLLALVAAALIFVGCSKKENTTASDTGALTMDMAFAKIEEYTPKTEDDTLSPVSVGEYACTLNEYRYFYDMLNQQLTMYYSYDWPEKEESKSIFDENLDGNVITDAVLYELCKENNITITEEDFQTDVVDLFAQIKEANGETFAADMGLSEYYVYQNLTFSAFYQKLYDALYLNGDGFEEAKQETLQKFEDEGYVHANHVLIAFPTNADGSEVTDEQKAEAKAKAEEVLEKINAGEDFNKLVEEYSDDPGKVNSPDGYYFTTGRMVQEFEDAAMALLDGEVSDIVETSYGYHIIKRLPLTEGDISTTSEFQEISYNKLDAIFTERCENKEVVKADNYDELIKPLEEKAAADREEYAAQMQAYYDSLETEEGDEEPIAEDEAEVTDAE